MGGERFVFTGQVGTDEAAANCCKDSCAATPPPPGTQAGTCTTFDEFEALFTAMDTACCSGKGGTADCSSGYPDSCDAACAAKLIPAQVACDDFLVGPLVSVKAALDSAAALCPHTDLLPSCANMDELQAQTVIMQAKSCDKVGDCTGGYPASCTARCAKLLLPLHAACQQVLSNPIYAPIAAAIDQAAALCPGSGH